jgi:prophage regulatory protein
MRKPEVLSRFRFSKSTLANKVNDGSFIPGCLIGPRSVAWISYELDAVAAAIATGKDQQEMKQLVSNLIIKRQELSQGSR